jgi:hypothetical protein
MHWRGNEDLRHWFRQNLDALGIEVVEGGEPSPYSIPDEIRRLISYSNLFIAVLTSGPRVFLDQELGIAAERGMPLLVLCDVTDAELPELLSGMERYKVVACPFRREHLVEDGHRIIKFFFRELNRHERERYEQRVGFNVRVSETGIHFYDWKHDTHSEVYEKELQILPLRDGELTVNIKSGSWAWKIRSSDNMIQSTRQSTTTVKDLADGYHVLTQTVIPNAIRGMPESLFERSERLDVTNASRDCIHPEYPEYSRESFWCVVFHVLYPTEVMRFNATFLPERGVVPGSVRVLHEAHGSQVEEVGSDISLVGDPGQLQFLRWERPYPAPQTDYLIIWKWAWAQ